MQAAQSFQKSGYVRRCQQDEFPQIEQACIRTSEGEHLEISDVFSQAEEENVSTSAACPLDDTTFPSKWRCLDRILVSLPTSQEPRDLGCKCSLPDITHKTSVGMS